MKTFNYHSAKNVKEASKLSSSKSAFLAGGMTTIPSMKLGLATYKDIIDIKGIKNLSGIKVSGKAVRIGATTKHVEVANSKDVKKSIPSLANLAEGIGDPQVRNRGTIGGSIANNDPAADYPSACIALNAVIHTNSRKIDANKFFKGMFETALKNGEIIEAIEFQIPQKSSYQKWPNPASRYAIVGVYVAKHKTGVNVAVTGAKPCVYNDNNLKGALSKNFSSSAVDNVKISSSGMNSDIHASSDYRANMVKVFAKKAVEASK
jgi:carbon-monoxide dehydrogenase medium subunit